MKLPTVKMKHRRTGEIKIINQWDYGRALGDHADWKIVTLQRGDAPEAVEDYERRQSDKTLHRKMYSKYGEGDRDRAFAERSLAGTNIEATPVSFTDDPEAVADEGGDPPPDPPKRKRGRPRKNKE